MANPQVKSNSKIYWLQILCALAGIGLSLYLLIQHTRLKNGIQGDDSFCTFGHWANCSTVNGSQYSEIAGIPLATLGYLFYSCLLILSLLARPQRKGFARAQRWAAWLAALGLVVDFGLALVQVAVIKTLCIMCASTYLASLGYLTVTILMAGRTAGGFGEKIKMAFTHGSKDNSRLSSKSLAFGTFGLVCLAILVAIVPGTVISKQAAAPNGDGGAAQLMEMWTKMPTQELPIKAGDGTIGNPAAKIRLIEFSDFECPFCQHAAGILHRALEPIKDKVIFAFKHFPLDSGCNPLLKSPMHPNSCRLAQLAYCAREKGKFWEYHDLVFSLEEKQLQGPIDDLLKPLSGIFSQNEFKACLDSNSARQNTKEDIDLGIKLQVNATPSLFINGKKMILPLTEENIQLLVATEEKLAGTAAAKQ